MKLFAKLYEVEKIGQILVKLDSNNDTGMPEVRFYFTSQKVGICSLALKFKDGEEEIAEKAFSNTTIHTATNMIKDAYKKIKSVIK